MSKKLLLADDSITIQKVIQITFAHEDYELTITDNGDAALDKAREVRPDLVMADVYMPGKNGYELASAIKADPALSHVPVLLLAGSFEPFDEEKARSCRADSWIEKPFESQHLIDRVAELLAAAPQAAAPSAAAEVAVPAAAPVEPVVPVFDEVSLDDFDEPLAAAPAPVEAMEDPFGDISFEEPAEVAPEPVKTEDDWSDLMAEPAPTAAEDAFAVVGSVELEAADEFGFAEEALPEVTESPIAALTAEESEFADFDMGDEIMPLGDDDILGAEDLEPVMEEQTLAAWSRTETEDPFAEESPAFDEEEPAFVEEAPAFVEEAPAFVEEAPAFVEEAPAFAEEAPAFVEEAPAFVEEAPAFVEEAPAFSEELPVAAPAAAAAVVEERLAALDEEQIERMIEKVVAGVVERLAASILERVAWEVVPDLAEGLIREEIRKIKNAAA